MQVGEERKRREQKIQVKAEFEDNPSLNSSSLATENLKMDSNGSEGTSVLQVISLRHPKRTHSISVDGSQ